MRYEGGILMLKTLFGIFLVLHGLVHLLYVGQSVRLFELQEGMVWPDGAWALSRLVGNDATRTVAAIAGVIAAVVFVAGGVGLLMGQGWSRPVIVAAALFSSALYLLLWDGQFQALPDKGGVGILINAAIILILLVGNWPPIDV